MIDDLNGELLTRWAVRLAMALYVLALLTRRRAGGNRSRLKLARLSWTVGCGMFLVHVALAFAFYHRWSHVAALQATALRTEEFVGVAWGGGLYLNYAFMLVWLADCLWWWRGLEQYEARNRLFEWIIQGFLALMAFNGTVVFASGTFRWVALTASLALAIICLFTNPLARRQSFH